MSNNVVHLFPRNDIAGGLRQLADAFEEGRYGEPDAGCTVILGYQVYHFGCISDAQSGPDAVFNMTFGIHG